MVHYAVTDDFGDIQRAVEPVEEVDEDADL